MQQLGLEGRQRRATWPGTTSRSGRISRSHSWALLANAWVLLIEILR